MDRLVERLRQRAVLHADETPVQQIDKKLNWMERNKPIYGRIAVIPWMAKTLLLCLIIKPVVQVIMPVIFYSSGKGIWWWMIMLVWSLFNDMITEVGCWAHVRPKFFELQVANQSSMAAEALRCIGLLYDIERRGKELGVTERQALRQTDRQTDRQTVCLSCCRCTSG